MSIKNSIAILISHIYRDQEIITKLVHYVTNVNSIKARLFAIRYRINYTTHLQDINHIIVTTDTILAAKQIFDILIYPYQLHFITILKNFKEFFNKSSNNFIDCSDSIK